MLVDIDLRDYLSMEPLAINVFFRHLGPLFSFGDKPDVDIFLCVDSLATRLWESMFMLFKIRPVFSWICSHYSTEMNEKGLIAAIRTRNNNRFHKGEQDIGIVHEKNNENKALLIMFKHLNL